MFESPLILEEYTNENEWVVHKTLRCVIVVDSVTYRLAVPRHFITDLASIPTLIQLVPGFKINGVTRKAGVLHDFLYSSGGSVSATKVSTNEVVTLNLSRESADLILRRACMWCGLEYNRSQLIYLAVRSAGFKYWNERSQGLNQDDFNININEVNYND